MDDATWEYISDNDYDENLKIQLMNNFELKEYYLDLKSPLSKKEGILPG